MTHKSKNADHAGLLTGILPENPESFQGEELKMLTSSTHNGHDHFGELPEAITEKDIISLRKQLQEISASFRMNDDLLVFDLAEGPDLMHFFQELENKDLENLVNRKPLPRIHIHHHRRAEKENIHQVYKEQNNESVGITETDADQWEDAEIPFLEEALKERDIMELRDTLQQIGKANSYNSYSSEEIDEYLHGDLSPEEIGAFDAELEVNQELKNDLILNAEVEEAVAEQDVMHLRDELERVVRSQHSTGRTLQEVDAFVEDELEETGKQQIMEEIAENGDLKSEVNLIKDINRAFAEKEIHQLRTKLAGISNGLDIQRVKSFILIPEKFRKARRNGTYAAVFLVLIGITSVIWNNQRENKLDYDKYFVMPQTVSSYRANEALNNKELSKGYEFFNRSDFVNALNCFNKVLVSEPRDQVIHFYAGIADRNIQHYPEALGHFQQVTESSIIILAEQAEWYKILCFLKMGQKDRALLQLEAVLDRKGFYYKDALFLQRKLHEDD
jgi:hypothetical protein